MVKLPKMPTQLEADLERYLRANPDSQVRYLRETPDMACKYMYEELKGGAAMPHAKAVMKRVERWQNAVKQAWEKQGYSGRPSPGLERPAESTDKGEPASTSLDFSGIDDVEFLIGFRDDVTQSGAVRLAAQKELSRVLAQRDAQARQAQQDKAWTPPGDSQLLAQAMVDVFRVQNPSTQAAFINSLAEVCTETHPEPGPSAPSSDE